MKRNHILLLAALMCGTAWAEEDNSFYFTDAAVLPGEKTSVELCMRNTATDLTCFEAEIQLPEGLSIVCDEEGNPVATLYANRIAEHEILTNVLENGNLKLLVSSIKGNLFRGEEGPLLNVLITDDATSLKTIDNGQLTRDNGEPIYDLSGRRIVNGQSSMANGRLKKGIFIKAGRKELHK